jgi:nucleoid-associated protein YgaU
MRIKLSSGGQYFYLPVVPEQFEYKTAVKIDVTEIIGLGEISIPGKKKLMKSSIKKFFPNKVYPFAYYENGFISPMEFVDLLERWENDGAAVLIEPDGFKKVQMYISAFDYRVQDGSGDIYYTISFIEAVDNQIVEAGATIDAISNTRIEKTVATVEYVVKSGDTLSAIAKKYTGKSDNWREIAKTNDIKDPRALQIGQKLVIT